MTSTLPAPAERPQPSSHTERVSLVLPTRNRAAALRQTFAGILALRGVNEIVVVDDASSDGTPAFLAGQRDARLRVLRLDAHRGSPGARNAGVAAASGDWIVFGEDDCGFPTDYVAALMDEAHAHPADVVGAPMVHPGHGDVTAAVAEARRRASGPGGLDAVAGFPLRRTVTPLVPATALIRASVFDHVRFDEGFGGNAYREETEFFIRATRAGFTCVLTPTTFFWEAGSFSGGQATRNGAGPRPVGRILKDEYWTLRNNWRLLRRHGRWLAAHGHIRSPPAEQLSFTLRRARRLWAPGAPS